MVFQPSDPKPGPNPEAIDDNADDQPTVLVDRMEEPATEEPAAELPSTTPDALANPEDLPNLEELANRDDPAEPSASGDRDAVIPPPITNPDRLAPSTSMVGSARDQVHEDGSLIKPKRKGPLAGLRERLAS